MCCGQKRTALKSTPMTVASPATSSATQHAHKPFQSPGVVRPALASSLHSTVRLRYVAKSPILVRGLVTGREYSFSGAQPVLPVDARDAEALLRTQFFSRALFFGNSG